MNNRQVLVYSRLKDNTTLTQQWNSIKNYHLFCIMPKYVYYMQISFLWRYVCATKSVRGIEFINSNVSDVIGNNSK